MEDETWLKHRWSGLYVSDMGRVKGKRGIPSLGHRNNGYYNYRNVYFESESVHILVLETFRPEHRRDQGFRAKWIDGNKLNNKLSNLEWVKRLRKQMSKQQRMQRDLKDVGPWPEKDVNPWPEKE